MSAPLGADGPGTRIAAEPNVTPMIDVLLVLLVTFLVALPLSRRAIDAQLPQPSQVQEGSPAISLTVLHSAGFRLNGELLPNELALTNRLREVYTDRPDRTIMVGADSGVNYDQVINAMDAARGAGVRVIGIAGLHPY